MQKKTVVIIDDENINLTLISGLLSDVYHVVEFSKGDDFLNHKFEDNPSLILLDIIMPIKDGFQVIKEIKNNEIYADVPVIFLTAKSDSSDEKLGIELGAVDYVTKPFSFEVLKLRINNHIKLIENNLQLKKLNYLLNYEVKKRVNDFKLIQDVSLGIITQILDQKDTETTHHIYRTLNYVNLIAKSLSNFKKYNQVLTQEYIEILTKASMLHDIGKVAVPDHILLKSGKLADFEFEIVKEHVKHGKESIDKAIKFISNQEGILEDVSEETIKFFEVAKDIAYYHHERYDGKGYLEGLQKEDIPLSARIMAVADVFDALISNKVYKSAWTIEQAFEFIESEKGRLFDPVIVNAFIKVKEDIMFIHKKYEEV
jgi:putative two-component system response regulator